MSNASDSHFRYVYSRMQTINPARQVLGVMEAQDWPPKQVRFESFYLLILAEITASESFASATVPVIQFVMQWVWMVAGTDLQTGLVGRSRGDRYRTDATMKGELRRALYPGYGEKFDWSLTGNSITSLQLQSTPLNPPEFMWWDRRPKVVTRTDKASGIIYSSADVTMTDMTEAILA